MSIELTNILRVEDPFGRVYYLGTFNPREIKQLTFVPVVTPSQGDSIDTALLNEDANNGYQRAGEPARMKKIAEFLAERPNSIIPPVLLSCRGEWEFEPIKPNSNFGKIRANALAAIIDGQHRLGGLWQLACSQEVDAKLHARPIPFMAVSEMELQDEKQEFVDINGNQKGVKKSLLRYLDRHKTFPGRAATALMEDEDSVFKGRIDEQKKRDWTLLLFGAIEECVELMFGRALAPKSFNPQKDEQLQESAIEFTLKYWRVVSEVLDVYWEDIHRLPPVGERRSNEHPGSSKFEYRLLEETGIRAFSRLAADLFALTWIEHARAPSWDTIRTYLGGLAESDVVRTALTKPKAENKEKVLGLNPDLKSTGKAGVDAIYIFLRDELMKVVQGVPRA